MTEPLLIALAAIALFVATLNVRPGLGSKVSTWRRVQRAGARCSS